MKTNSNSREHILAAIRKNKPDPVTTPCIPPFSAADATITALRQQFTDMLRSISATVAFTDSAESLQKAISECYPNAATICSVHPSVTGNVAIADIQHPAELAGVDLAIVEGLFGVAENGAIWLTEAQMGHRALPFITQHLVIVLPADRLVGNMHEAYANIRSIDSGFGIFISGPSRTADIEQSLVVGAHGARSLLVCLHQTK
ncbi:LutC/YkgG family protein [Rhodoflexus sp.]